VRTFQVGMASNDLPPKEKLVMTHGYGGSIVMFWPMMRELAQDYHLIMFDILGMGSSSRPEFNIDNEQEANEFFVGWMEKWRVAIGILQEKFILCGHSFGGYISGHYTKKYP
jgi:pimeloyl-ACP methyl ester carboxylesterase